MWPLFFGIYFATIILVESTGEKSYGSLFLIRKGTAQHAQFFYAQFHLRAPQKEHTNFESMF